MASATQMKGIKRTVFAVLVFIVVVVVGFILRIFQPTILSVAEMQANGTMIFSAPRQLTDFKLVDHHGTTFTRESITGRWTLVFLGSRSALTYAPRP